MSSTNEPPQFDPATWTPDKPWPKGYYKPVPGVIANIERQDRASGEGMGFRRFLWGLVTLPLQGTGLAAATSHGPGLLHTIAIAVTPLPLFLLFALALPSLLYVGIVAPDAKLRRSFAYGFGWSLAALVVVIFVVLGRPAMDAFFNWLRILLS